MSKKPKPNPRGKTPHWVAGLHEHIRESEERILTKLGQQPGSCDQLATKQDLTEMETRIMKTLADLDAEIQGDLNDAATAIEAALTAALANITVPPDVQPQFDRIAAIAAALKAAATPGGPPLVVPPLAKKNNFS
jgi:hypothetical protein